MNIHEVGISRSLIFRNLKMKYSVRTYYGVILRYCRIYNLTIIQESDNEFIYNIIDSKFSEIGWITFEV